MFKSFGLHLLIHDKSFKLITAVALILTTEIKIYRNNILTSILQIVSTKI